MYRFVIEYLNEWKVRSSRKPLVIRGARQVGKTYIVREFSKLFDNYIEINFENEIEVAQYFNNKDPRTIIELLSLHYNKKIIAGKTLVFFDEVQSAPEIFAKLRYFYEEIPNLHIIAAGSLLEFILDEHTFSMPVGRIEYLHLGPMSFKEFLKALGNEKLVEFLENFSIENEIPTPIHYKLISHFKSYLVVGGMPESVLVYRNENSFFESDRVKQSILETYSDDFRKYRKRINYQLLLTAYTSIPQIVCRKVKYTHISKDYQAKVISSALRMFSLAKVCYPVYHSSANGIPLGAEINVKLFKLLFLDVGLLCRALGLTMANIETIDLLELVNIGNITEQFIGQHLLYRDEYYTKPELYYWLREKTKSNAEVDYLISNGLNIIPIEVKVGKTGSLKSLNQFIAEKKCKFAVRFNIDKPSLVKSTGKLPTKTLYNFELLSLPVYLVEEICRLVNQVQ